jgi:hypothetical protein
MYTMFTLETQTGKLASNGGSIHISAISNTVQLLALYASLSWPTKSPLRVKTMEEIERAQVRERPTTMTLHFPLLNFLYYFILCLFFN